MAIDIESAPRKRRKYADQSGQQPLLPGLPDHLAQLCLSLVPPSLLYSVCHSWRRLIYSPSFPPFLSLYALLSSSSSSSSQSHHNHHHQSNQDQSNGNSIDFFSFDPISSTWHQLPPPPPDPRLRPLLLRHPSFIARNLPIQSITVSGHLVLVAATTHDLLPALSRPLIFHPLSNHWRLGPTISAPRRWCAAGSTDGAVYVVSGVGSHYSGEVARSAERWNLKKKREWEKVAALKHGRFSREAVEAVGWKGKLCMVNVKGNVAKEGLVYDVERNKWEEMPEGMLMGWNGPAAAMDEDVIYVVDEAKGVLRKYNPLKDCWDDLIQSPRLRGAVQIAAAGGRVCAIQAEADGAGILVVDVVASPPTITIVQSPPESQPVSLHILPRMSWMDSGL